MLFGQLSSETRHELRKKHDAHAERVAAFGSLETLLEQAQDAFDSFDIRLRRAKKVDSVLIYLEN
jgi:hypothetical protein